MVKHRDNLKALASGNDCAKSYMKMVSENQQIVDNVDFKGGETNFNNFEFSYCFYCQSTVYLVVPMTVHYISWCTEMW